MKDAHGGVNGFPRRSPPRPRGARGCPPAGVRRATLLTRTGPSFARVGATGLLAGRFAPYLALAFAIARPEDATAAQPPWAARSRYSTVTLFARLRGWSTSVPFDTAT